MDHPPSIGKQVLFIISAAVDARKTIISAISSGFPILLLGWNLSAKFCNAYMDINNKIKKIFLHQDNTRQLDEWENLLFIFNHLAANAQPNKSGSKVGYKSRSFRCGLSFELIWLINTEMSLCYHDLSDCLTNQLVAHV